MKSILPNGLLIVFDGIDGAGKTTQAALLCQLFGARGYLCSLSKEPTSNKWGRILTKSAAEGRLSIEEELELFIKDRKDHVATTIRPTLQSGGVSILDRYYYSTVAYQGSRGSDIGEIIRQHEEFAPEPDLAIILDVSPDRGRERIFSRGDTPNEFENVHALAKARDIFIQLATERPNVILVDGNRSIAAVKREVQQLVLRSIRARIDSNQWSKDEIQAALDLLEDELVDHYPNMVIDPAHT